MKPYKLAEIYTANKDLKKPWYVYYSFINPETNKFQVFQEKKGINRFKTIRERMEQAKQLRVAINQLLESGFNPFSKTETESDLDFIQAIDYALDKKKLFVSERTIIEYNSQLKYIKQSITNVGFDKIKITKIKRSHIKQVLYEIKKNHSVNTYNKYLSTLKSIFSILVDDLIEVSPIHGLKAEKKEQTEGYKSFESEIKNKIRKLLYKDSFAFGVIGELIYETGIRPNEVLCLKWKDINFDRLSILITGANSKNSKLRLIPIKQGMAEKLGQLYLDNLSPNLEWFIFGNKNTLESKPTKLNRNRLSERWHDVIHVEGKISTEYKLYGLKHTGADDKIMAGVDLEFLKDLYGHHSTKMTRIYAKKIIEKGADVIRKNAPDF
jgi:site-specific recombinase XerD